MKVVSVAEFRRNPSAHLAGVRAGLSFLLANRGKVVARVDPFDPKDDWHLHYAELVSRGLVKPPAGKRRG